MFRSMISGAIDDKGATLGGRYKPEEFGKLTLWQMKYLFGYRARPKVIDAKDAYWNRCRILGKSEFEIWSGWQPVREQLEAKQKNMTPMEQQLAAIERMG